MQGWKRDMTFAETGLPWVPPSPHIPRADSSLYYVATGMVGAAWVSQGLAFRHNNRGHLVMGDLHLETMNIKQYDQVQKTKRFWFPTDNTTGPGGMGFSGFSN